METDRFRLTILSIYEPIISPYLFKKNGDIMIDQYYLGRVLDITEDQIITNCALESGDELVEAFKNEDVKLYPVLSSVENRPNEYKLTIYLQSLNDIGDMVLRNLYSFLKNKGLRGGMGDSPVSHNPPFLSELSGLTNQGKIQPEQNVSSDDKQIVRLSLFEMWDGVVLETCGMTKAIKTTEIPVSDFAGNGESDESADWVLVNAPKELFLPPGLRDLEIYLNQRVVGQERAVKYVIEAISLKAGGIQKDYQPITVLFFAGPTGVGKTEITRALGDYFDWLNNKIYETYKIPRPTIDEPDFLESLLKKKKVFKKELRGEKSLIQVDCGKFSGQPHAGTILTGAPPSYVGFENKPIFSLLNFVDTQFSILLLDEFEKVYQTRGGIGSGKEIENLFLQVFDRGEISNNKGENISFRNTIIIMTSNIGNRDIMKVIEGEITVGFNKPKNKLTRKEQSKKIEEINDDIYRISTEKLVQSPMSPEFYNRIRKVVVFRYLSPNILKKIFDKEISDLNKQLKDKHDIIIQEVSKEAKDFIVSETKISYGVRALQRELENLILEPLVRCILAKRFIQGDIIRVSLGKSNEIQFYRYNKKP